MVRYCEESKSKVKTSKLIPFACDIFQFISSNCGKDCDDDCEPRAKVQTFLQFLQFPEAVSVGLKPLRNQLRNHLKPQLFRGGRKICISACLGVGPVISMISESSKSSAEVVLEPRGNRPRSQLADSGTALDVCFKQQRIVTGTVNSDVEKNCFLLAVLYPFISFYILLCFFFHLDYRIYDML